MFSSYTSRIHTRQQPQLTESTERLLIHWTRLSQLHTPHWSDPHTGDHSTNHPEVTSHSWRPEACRIKTTVNKNTVKNISIHKSTPYFLSVGHEDESSQDVCCCSESTTDWNQEIPKFNRKFPMLTFICTQPWPWEAAGFIKIVDFLCWFLRTSACGWAHRHMEVQSILI